MGSPPMVSPRRRHVNLRALATGDIARVALRHRDERGRADAPIEVRDRGAVGSLD